MRQGFAACLLLPVLAGCATTPMTMAVDPPPEAPAATIVNELVRAHGRNESIAVYLAGGEDCKTVPPGKNPGYRTLYWMTDNTDGAEKTKKVSALQPMRFYYREYASGGRKCEIVADTVLLPGRTYRLKGGFAYKDGPIPILTGTRLCQLELVDSTTGQAVMLRPRQSGAMCEGQMGDIAKKLQALF
jgi:hypothetical protein